MIFFNPACKVVYLWIVPKSCNQYLGLEYRNTLRIAEIKVFPATKRCLRWKKWLWTLRPFAALHYTSRALACLERGKRCIRTYNRRLMETKYSMALPAPLPIWGILGPYCLFHSPGGGGDLVSMQSPVISRWKTHVCGVHLYMPWSE